MATNYQKLTLRLEEISRLGGIMGILHWDQEVIMPIGAAESRAKQMGALAGIIHEKSTDPEIGSLLEKIKQENSFNSCLLYTSPSPRDATLSRMPSSA